MEEKENPSFQIEISSALGVNEEIDENKTKHILEKLQIQWKNGHPHNKNSLCWFFYFVNSNSKITFHVPQTTRCLLFNLYYLWNVEYHITK